MSWDANMREVYAYRSNHELDKIKGGLLERIDIIRKTSRMDEFIQVLIDPSSPDANEESPDFVEHNLLNGGRNIS